MQESSFRWVRRDCLNEEEVRDEIAMAKHYPFRPTRSPPSVENACQIITANTLVWKSSTVYYGRLERSRGIVLHRYDLHTLSGERFASGKECRAYD